MGPVTIDSISHATFKKVLKRYPSTVPDKLRELDTLRYETIPGAVANRAAEEKGGAYLKAEEVEKLVEWKLYVCPYIILSHSHHNPHHNSMGES
jgi:hypothetical protein